ncbi:AAA family ATPase, partial [Glaesserella parasuis]|nr:AAA family ATPase [Glaesserella parasuis]
MLKKLVLKNFTVFNEVDLNFSPHLNVIIGENGMGKSHILKLAYSLIACN